LDSSKLFTTATQRLDLVLITRMITKLKVTSLVSILYQQLIRI